MRIEARSVAKCTVKTRSKIPACLLVRLEMGSMRCLFNRSKSATACVSHYRIPIRGPRRLKTSAMASATIGVKTSPAIAISLMLK